MRKQSVFTLKVEADLRDRFMRAAAASHRPASQIVRDFMRDYIAQSERQRVADEARRQSLAIAERARDPHTDEHALMRELDAELDASDEDGTA